MSTVQQLIPVHNPYPEWQSLAADTNCWNCYKLLWRQANVKAHLCDGCQQVYVAEVDIEPASTRETTSYRKAGENERQLQTLL